MAISENLLGTVGTFTSVAGGGITGAANGITTTSSNSYALSSATMTPSNTYQKIEYYVIWATGCYVGPGLHYGPTWDKHFRVQISNDGNISIAGSFGNVDSKASGVTSGSTVKIGVEYDNGTINGYLNDVLKCTYDFDLSAFSTWKPIFWVHDTSCFVRSYQEILPGGGTGCLFGFLGKGIIPSVRNC